MDTITPEEIQAVERATTALAARARLLDLACGGLCAKGLNDEANLSYADVEPVDNLAKEVTSLANALESEILNLRAKITPARVRVGE